MRLLFAIFKYFPHGGLQRDMLEIAEEAIRRGHAVTVAAMEWNSDAEPPAGLSVVTFPVKGLSNHARAAGFVKHLKRFIAANEFDGVVGFNRMPGLDVYFAGDTCFAKNAEKHHRLVRTFLPRYRVFLAYEKAVFEAEKPPLILHLTHGQKQEYCSVYQTPPERFHLLPPGIPKDRKCPPEPGPVREYMRDVLEVGSREVLMIQVGSGYRTKGVDRTIRALAAFPKELLEQVRLLVAGREKSTKYERLAQGLGLGGRVIFAGPRDDIPKLLWASDLLVHPARNEAAGSVLIEAIAAGLPVVCTENCGFCTYVKEAGGITLPEPFSEQAYLQCLCELIKDRRRLEKIRSKCHAYGQNADFYRRSETAVDAIEEALHGAKD